MSLVLRWRVPEPPIVTRWRGPAGIAAAVTRRPLAPIAAVIGPVGAAGAQGVPGPQGPMGQPQRIDFTYELCRSANCFESCLPKQCERAIIASETPTDLCVGSAVGFQLVDLRTKGRYVESCARIS